MIMAVIIRFYELRWPAAAGSDGTHSIIDIDVKKSAVELVTVTAQLKLNICTVKLIIHIGLYFVN